MSKTNELHAVLKWANTSLNSVKSIMWRYKDALEIIAGDGCESFASGHSCIKSPERHRQSLCGAHTWCVACIARHALESDHQPVQEVSGGE